jgi:hypothetical protein
VTYRKKWKDLVRQAKSPQWAVVPVEEKEALCFIYHLFENFRNDDLPRQV